MTHSPAEEPALSSLAGTEFADIDPAEDYRMTLLTTTSVLGRKVATTCVDLELERGLQHHSWRTTNGTIRVLAGYILGEAQQPIGMRLTYNEIEDIKVGLYGVAIEDFGLSFFDGVSYRTGTRTVQRVPDTPASAAPPVIWQAKNGHYRRYSGNHYSLGPAQAFDTFTNTELERRVMEMQRLTQICRMLSRSVSLDNEYPYQGTKTA